MPTSTTAAGGNSATAATPLAMNGMTEAEVYAAKKAADRALLTPQASNQASAQPSARSGRINLF